MSNMTKTMAVFSGSAHPELAREIANALGVELGDIHLCLLYTSRIESELAQTLDLLLASASHDRADRQRDRT